LALGRVGGAGPRDGKVGGAFGLTGAAVPGAAWLRIETGRLEPSDSKVNDMLVMKKARPKMAVVRVSVLAAPRGENNPPSPEPPPPMPSAPPSERCNSTTQISAIATRR
jgi:hypothetical protein